MCETEQEHDEHFLYNEIQMVFCEHGSLNGDYGEDFVIDIRNVLKNYAKIKGIGGLKKC